MSRFRLWLLPALLAAGQLALWPGIAAARGDALDPRRLVVTLAAVAVVTAAAVGRVRFPVASVLLAGAAIGAGSWLLPDQLFFVPGDTLLVLSVADLVLLYNVGVRTDRRATALALAGAVGLQTVATAGQSGLGADLLGDTVANVVTYGLVAAMGRLRQRWLADRADAARRLAEARAAEREAAAAERRRLARELHDVTAHHLTSVVVNASAADLLGDQRPELRTEAAAFAARTGRETLTALRELVAVLPSAAEAEQTPALADLVDDFRQLGQIVSLDLRGEPASAEIAAAVHGIAREALTNTLRYSPGTPVQVSVDHTAPDGVRLLVRNDGTPAAPVTGLGGGRGIAGMRDRAESLGGTLTAGPLPDGGWEVRAVIPGGRPTLPKIRRWLRSQLAFDAGLVALLLVFPVIGVVLAVEEDGLAPGPAALLLVVVVAHTVPLMWRRNAARAVLTAVVLTTWPAVLLFATDVVPTGGWAFAFAAPADLAAVYAVAAFGARPRLSWLAPLAVAASGAGAFVVMLALPGPDVVVSGLVTGGFIGFLLLWPAAAAWLAGHLVRRRRQRRSDREEGAVAVATAQAEQQARAERARIAAGLRGAVLHHAAEIPRAADRADLAAVVTHARAALTAMRSLLDSLGTRPAREAEEVPTSLSV
ncbi:sensor histidine kinase [Symbioplanes lichenis]|uniref:sensor histidine kinase n=1 Tax=Symbioplanes lichenis TaxID=1629072 RepID=UPI00273874A2|nr:histidine kinase [Actinoplanes lichenis]